MANSKLIVKEQDLENLGRLQCTAREAAAFLDIRVDLFNRLLKKNPKFAEAWNRGKQSGLVSLRRKQMRLAAVSAPMAIFLGKNYLSQREVSIHEVTGEDGGPVELDLSRLTREERDDLRRTLTKAAQSKEGSKGS